MDQSLGVTCEIYNRLRSSTIIDKFKEYINLFYDCSIQRVVTNQCMSYDVT